MSLSPSTAAARLSVTLAKAKGNLSPAVLSTIVVAGLAIVTAACVFTWFPDLTAVFIRADSDVPLNILNIIGSATSIFSSANFGSDNARLYPVVVPYIGFWYVLRHVLQDGAIQYLWWTALVVTGIWGIRFFLQTLRMSAVRSPFAIAWAVVLFSFNAYSALSFATGHDVLYLAYVASPWMLGFAIRGVRKGLWRDAIFAAIVSAIIAGAYSNPPIIVTALVLPALAWATFECRSHWSALFRFTWRFALVAAVLNAWWLLPFVRLLLTASGEQTIVPPDQHFDWPNFTNPIESHFTLFGLGYWGFFTGVGGHPYFPTAGLLWNPFALVGYAMAIALAVYGTSRGTRRELAAAVPALLLFVLGLLGAKANNDPFGAAGMWFFQHIPGFWIFRSAYEKFGATSLIGLSVAAAIGFAVLERRFRTDALRLSISRCVAICALAGVAYPFLSGTIVKTNNAALGYTAFSHIPTEYDDLYVRTRRLPEGRILVLPGIEYGRYVWGAASGDLLRHYLGQDYLEDSPGYVGSNVGRIMIQRLDGIGRDFPYLARIAHVRYVLVRSDVDLGQFGYHTDLSNALERLRAYVGPPIYADPYFKLYALKAEPLPKAYVARDAWLLRPGTDNSAIDSSGRTAVVSGDSPYPEPLMGQAPVREAVDDWCGRKYGDVLPYCDAAPDAKGNVAGVSVSEFSKLTKLFSVRVLPKNGTDLTGFSSEPLEVPGGRAVRIAARVVCKSNCIGGLAVLEANGMYRHYHAFEAGVHDYAIVLAPQARSRAIQLQAEAVGTHTRGDMTINGSLRVSIGDPSPAFASVVRPLALNRAYRDAPAMPLVFAPLFNGTPLLRHGIEYALPSLSGIVSLHNPNETASLIRVALYSANGKHTVRVDAVSGAPYAWREGPWTFLVIDAKQTATIGIRTAMLANLVAERVESPVPIIGAPLQKSQIVPVLLKRTWYGYRVRTSSSSPGLLVLSDSFDRNWQVIGVSARHYMAQLYANGWRLGPNHPRAFAIVYWGRVLQGAGLIVTVLGIIALLIFWWIPKRALQN